MAISDGLKKYFKMLPPQLEIVNRKAAEIAAELYQAAIASDLFTNHEKFNPGYEHRLEKYLIYYDIGKCETSCQELKVDQINQDMEMLANRKYMSILTELYTDARLTAEERICKEILYYANERNESYDGMGFPNCLKGNAISPIGRILCVADFIAREFIDGTQRDDLLKKLKLRLGKRFDPEVVLLANPIVEGLYERERATVPQETEEFRSIKVLYQPVCDASGNASVENVAYICLNDPKQGVLMPAFYGPIAERNGRIMDIVKFGFEILFQDMSNSKLGGLDLSRNFSVGVPMECLNKPAFLTMVKKLIREFSVNPRRLIFELNASDIELSNQKLTEILQAYRELGIKLAIDNYGVDTASLAKLQELDVDIIKMDRSFIDKITTNRKTYEIVKNMVKMGQDLNIAVIAKGVDNEQQKDLLLEMTCFCMQGRLFGEPAEFRI